MNEILQKRIVEAAIKVSDVCEPCDYGDPFCASCHRPYMYDAAKKMGEVILNNQWISVEEALPDKGHEVLVAILNTKTNTHFFGFDAIVDDSLFLRDKNGFTIDVDYHKITHWMPIPEMKGGE